jgi:hypothetical protein
MGLFWLDAGKYFGELLVGECEGFIVICFKYIMIFAPDEVFMPKAYLGIELMDRCGEHY